MRQTLRTSRLGFTQPRGVRSRCPLGWLLALGFGLAAFGCASTEAPLGSIGVVLGKSPESGALYVREAPGDDRFEEALLPGDRIVSVDGAEVGPMSSAELRAALRGPVGSKLRLTVLRGDAVRRLEIVRVPLRDAAPRPAREERLEE